MSSFTCEDAGLLISSELETQRRNSSAGTSQQQRTERRRTSTQRSEAPEAAGSNIIISPEDIPDEYENKEDYPGLFLLFNHEEFVTHDQRFGSTKDQDDLVDCLTRLRYEVTTDLLHRDFTKSQIENELKKVVEMDHTERSSLIVVFLTHGGEDGKLYSSDEGFITCQELWNLFTADKCPTLKGKPKIFIFQACKGKGKSKAATNEVQVDGICREALAKKVYTIPAEADILVAYSTLEGNVSYRHSLQGSWFIQELCKNLRSYGRRDDIVTIFTRISKCVAYHYQHEDYKQMPCFVSTLTRKFYLCKSKERDYIFETQKRYKKILDKMSEMQEQIDALLQKRSEEKQAQNEAQRTSAKPLRKISNTYVIKTSLPEKPRWRN